ERLGRSSGRRMIAVGRYGRFEFCDELIEDYERSELLSTVIGDQFLRSGSEYDRLNRICRPFDLDEQRPYGPLAGGLLRPMTSRRNRNAMAFTQFGEATTGHPEPLGQCVDGF